MILFCVKVTQPHLGSLFLHHSINHSKAAQNQGFFAGFQLLTCPIMDDISQAGQYQLNKTRLWKLCLFCASFGQWKCWLGKAALDENFPGSLCHLCYMGEQFAARRTASLFSEPTSDIASMGAEFAVLVTVGSKTRATKRADKIICSLAIKLTGVCYPPIHAAFIGTEFFYLPSGDYFHLLSALFAICTICAWLLNLMKAISLTVGFDCIL